MTAFEVRDATEDDVDAIVAYEIEIAKVSFAEKAIVDPAEHERPVRRAIGDEREGTFVAVATVDGARTVAGWLWISDRSNFRTGEHYANFRSLAVTPSPDQAAVSQALIDRAIAFARERHLTTIVGRVHVGNVAMRALYRANGFVPEHLTMSLSLEEPTSG